MPRIIINPNLAECPDYSLDIYQASRQPFIDNACTPEQAAQFLRNIWATNNETEKTLWQNQVQADAEADAENRRLEDEDNAAREADKRKEEEDLQKEERKKNRAKFAPIPNIGVPNQTPVIPVLSAVRRMKKGEYVQMWYYTNQGLSAALRSFCSTSEDTMTMVRGADGSATWVPASSNESKAMIEDKDLDWEDFSIASARMVKAMEEAGWGADRVQMMINFWSNIQRHSFRSSSDPLDKKALLLYQDEQRRKWHFCMEGSDVKYNLSEINEDLLRETKSTLYWKNCYRRDEERENSVRTLPLNHEQ